METRTAKTIARPIGRPNPSGVKAFAVMAAEMAMIAPTDRSTPPVPMTSAIPVDTMITTEVCTASSWMVPRVRKLFVAAAL